MFFRYEQYLNSEFLPDYWYDEGILAAHALLEEFTSSDWARLAQDWRQKSSNWKVKCAETIDSHPSPIVVNILVDMLRDLDSDVVIAAADSLRSIPQSLQLLAPGDIERLSILRDQAGPVTKAVLDNLLTDVRSA